MAESTRQLVGSRVATPKIGNQGPGELDAFLSKAIGARVKITTSAPSLTIEGTLFTACPITNIIAINTTSLLPNPSSNAHAQPSDYHLVPVSHIQSLSVIALYEPATRLEGSPSGFDGAVPSIARVDLRTLKAREQVAIQKIREKDAMRGKGVGKEAQDLFDMLAKTLPTRWHGTSIIVSDAVIVAPPYTQDNCTAPKDQHNALIRVKKVLEHERRKLAERAGKGSTSIPPAAMRKGG